jgi:hypothetical protein
MYYRLSWGNISNSFYFFNCAMIALPDSPKMSSE